MKVSLHLPPKLLFGQKPWKRCCDSVSCFPKSGGIRSYRFTVQVRNLRRAYKDFEVKPDIDLLIATVEGLLQKLGGEQATTATSESKPPIELKREDLRLICFDFVSGG
jgi:hypothetical protein